jgi:3',5'-cyclic-nucleotide phosphodiesterase
LNGKGYPYGLRGDEIPVQAKMMIICDIFDALCSADRPYKNAVPLHVAFEILEMAVQRDELDPELCRIFMDARIFDLAREPKSQSSEDETAPTRIPN